MADTWRPQSYDLGVKVAELERRICKIESGIRDDEAGPWLTLGEAARESGLSVTSLRQRMMRAHGPLRCDVVRFPDGSPVPSGDRVVRASDLLAELAAHPVQEGRR